MVSRCEYIICHGSENRFLMIDAVANSELGSCVDYRKLTHEMCRLMPQIDGVLLLVPYHDGYAMRMFNTDGSEAEMCGNGIRCVARLVAERYIKEDHFVLWSGGRQYPISRQNSLYEDIPTFGVEIAISVETDDFIYPNSQGGFVDCPIDPLDPNIRFTYLNLGNPHIVACVEQIDVMLLERIGKEVCLQQDIFRWGVNVSFFCKTTKNGIYVATYERGVGATNSCGTAMTASSMAACLINICRFNEWIDVTNKGGMVRCRCQQNEKGLSAELVGNATYESCGVMIIDRAQGITQFCDAEIYDSEIAKYQEFKQSIIG